MADDDGREMVTIDAIEDGWVTARGEVILADGTRHPALLDICVMDSGEHYGTHLQGTDGKWVHQSEPDFLDRIGKTKAEAYPYRYRYDLYDRGQVDDIHINPESGWSA